MYNGIGVQTARGTGTSGYVQANLSALNFSKHKKAYNAEPDIARAEAEVNKKPNAELLDHEYKRRIEIRCVEMEDLMEMDGISAEEIDKKVGEYRKCLFAEFEAGQMKLDKELDIRNSHSRMKIGKDKRDNMRKALGISSDFVDGTSMAGMKKPNDPELTGEGEDPEIALKKKIMEEMKAEKAKKRLEKGKTTNSSSGDSSSSSDSSDTSSSSESEEEAPPPKKKTKSSPPTKKKRSRDSSTDSSSSSENEKKRRKKSKNKKADSDEDNKEKVQEEIRRQQRKRDESPIYEGTVRKTQNEPGRKDSPRVERERRRSGSPIVDRNRRRNDSGEVERERRRDDSPKADRNRRRYLSPTGDRNRRRNDSGEGSKRRREDSVERSHKRRNDSPDHREKRRNRSPDNRRNHRSDRQSRRDSKEVEIKQEPDSE